ncbi:hypothetical protein [Ottowia sp.]|uniref:hypothetical protein n=1 Tax=Ottowia sp. TaxID=1898956 RepID=UPI0039E72277
MKIHVAAALISALGLAGCASPVKVSPETSATLRGQTVVVTARKAPAFRLHTNSQVFLGGLLGAIGGAISDGIAVDQGSAFATRYRLVQPSEAVASSLAQALRTQRDMRIVSPPLAVEDGEEPDALASKAAPRARYVLDVRTGGWELSSQFGQSRYLHAVVGSLIDTQSRQVVSQDTCRTPLPPPGVEWPKPEAMVADDAARLRSDMKAATDACVAQLRQSVLGL